MKNSQEKLRDSEDTNRMDIVGQNGNDGEHYLNVSNYKDICYVGVDPGKTGFISLKIRGEYEFIQMPYHKVDKKSVFNEEGFSEIYNYLNNMNVKFKVAIEEVGGRGGWSATNNFNFGHIAGMLKQLFILLGAEITMIRPQKWQTYMRQGYPDLKKASSTGKTQIRDPKAVAEMIVDKEWPDIDFRKTERSRKNDDNKIDSFLIMQYLIRKNK